MFVLLFYHHNDVTSLTQKKLLISILQKNNKVYKEIMLEMS